MLKYEKHVFGVVKYSELAESYGNYPQQKYPCQAA